MRVATRAAKPSAAKSTLVKRVVAAAAPARSTRATPAAATAGVALGISGTRRYQLFKPLGVRSSERLPLLVMLHGCTQDAQGLAASSQMNRVATR